MNQDIKITDINTGYPGFLYNFDKDTQTADVQLAIETSYIGLDTGYKLKSKDRLISVPVQFQRGGGWSLTFPINDGTPCYVHFAQRGIDHWLMNGSDSAGMLNGKPAPQFNQFFSYNNAVAVVGINPITSAIGNFATDGVELRNDDHDQIISLKNDGSINLVSGSSTITIKKSGDVIVNTPSQATIKAEGIKLDGDTTVTKSLTVVGESNLNGGVNATGGSGEASMNITGKMTITGTINDIQVEAHVHQYDWTDGAGSSSTDAPMPM